MVTLTGLQYSAPIRWEYTNEVNNNGGVPHWHVLPFTWLNRGYRKTELVKNNFGWYKRPLWYICILFISSCLGLIMNLKMYFLWKKEKYKIRMWWRVKIYLWLLDHIFPEISCTHWHRNRLLMRTISSYVLHLPTSFKYSIMWAVVFHYIQRYTTKRLLIRIVKSNNSSN